MGSNPTLSANDGVGNDIKRIETHCNIDPITKDIVVFNYNITDVNADAKFNPLDLRYNDIVFGQAALNFDRAAYGIYDAAELDESTVPGILDDASVMLSYFGIKKRPSKRLQLRQRAFFVDPYQATRARDIGRQNSRQSPLYVLAAQGAPPRLGEIQCSLAQLWTGVRLGSRPLRVDSVEKG